MGLRCPIWGETRSSAIDFGFREAETKLIQGPYFSRQKKECHSKMWNMMINHEISAFPLSLDKAIWFHQGSRLFSILGCRATSAKKVPNVTKHRCRWRRSCRTGRCSGCSDRRSRPRIAPCIHQGTALIPARDWEMAQNDMNDMGILSDINDHIPMMKASKKTTLMIFKGEKDEQIGNMRCHSCEFPAHRPQPPKEIQYKNHGHYSLSLMTITSIIPSSHHIPTKHLLCRHITWYLWMFYTPLVAYLIYAIKHY